MGAAVRLPGVRADRPRLAGDAATAEETRAHPEAVAGVGIGDVTDHYSEVISRLSSPPVVIGHSSAG